MKKIIMLALVLTTLGTTAFSNNPDNISKQALNSFNKTYATASDVKWEAFGNCLKATFRIDGQQMFAYYHDNGEQIAITRNITASQLPITLSTELKEKCKDQWLTELFEIYSDNETAYFATLYSADRITVLKANASGSWGVFKKTKRTAQ